MASKKEIFVTVKKLNIKIDEEKLKKRINGRFVLQKEEGIVIQAIDIILSEFLENWKEVATNSLK